MMKTKILLLLLALCMVLPMVGCGENLTPSDDALTAESFNPADYDSPMACLQNGMVTLVDGNGNAVQYAVKDITGIAYRGHIDTLIENKKQIKKITEAIFEKPINLTVKSFHSFDSTVIAITGSLEFGWENADQEGVAYPRITCKICGDGAVLISVYESADKSISYISASGLFSWDDIKTVIEED